MKNIEHFQMTVEGKKIPFATEMGALGRLVASHCNKKRGPLQSHIQQ